MLLSDLNSKCPLSWCAEPRAPLGVLSGSNSSRGRTPPTEKSQSQNDSNIFSYLLVFRALFTTSAVTSVLRVIYKWIRYYGLSNTFSHLIGTQVSIFMLSQVYSSQCTAKKAASNLPIQQKTKEKLSVSKTKIYPCVSMQGVGRAIVSLLTRRYINLTTFRSRPRQLLC